MTVKSRKIILIKGGNMTQNEFNKLMEKYEETHESSLLNFARDLYMVVTFLCVAYLVILTLI